MKNKVFKRTLTIALAFVLLLALMVPLFAITPEDVDEWIDEYNKDHPDTRPEFVDVPDTHWAHDAIQYLAWIGVVNGIGDNKFDPEGGVKYDEFYTMIFRMTEGNYYLMPELFGYDLRGKPWWWLGMELAKRDDLLVGTAVENAYANGSWDLALLEKPVTRYDMAQILYNIYKGNVDTYYSWAWMQRVAEPSISDFAKIPENYKSAVTWAYQFGLLNGVDPSGTFDGSSGMKRSEAVVVITRLESQARTNLYPTEDYLVPVGAGYSIDHPTSAPKSGYLTSGKPISEENIAEIIEKLKVEYPNGGKWDDSDAFEYFSRIGFTAYEMVEMYRKGTVRNGDDLKNITDFYPYELFADPYLGGNAQALWFGGCDAFALMLQSALFGADPMINPMTVHQDISKVKIGDIIITGYPWGTKETSNGHWQVVYGFAKDSKGNIVPMVADGNPGIGWSNGAAVGVINKWNPSDRECFIITRWPV